MEHKSEFENIPIVNITDQINEINLTEIGVYGTREKIRDLKTIEKQIYILPLFRFRSLSLSANETQKLEKENLKQLIRYDLSLFNAFIKSSDKKGFFVITDLSKLEGIDKLSNKLEIKDKEHFLGKIVEYSLHEKYSEALEFSLLSLYNENQLNQKKLFDFFPDLISIGNGNESP